MKKRLVAVLNFPRPIIYCHAIGDPILIDIDRGEYEGVTEDAVAIIEWIVAKSPGEVCQHLFSRISSLNAFWKDLVERLSASITFTSDQLTQILPTTGQVNSIEELKQIVAAGIDHAQKDSSECLGPEHLLLATLTWAYKENPRKEFEILCQISPGLIRDALSEANRNYVREQQLLLDAAVKGDEDSKKKIVESSLRFANNIAISTAQRNGVPPASLKDKARITVEAAIHRFRGQTLNDWRGYLLTELHKAFGGEGRLHE